MIRHCKECGASSVSSRIIHNSSYGDLCGKCYQRVKASPKVHEKPSYGEITHDENGKPICHICGRAYKKLMSHVHQVHDITEKEYKKEFGLDLGKGIMSEESTSLARTRLFENEGVIQNLLVHGEATRFQKGDRGRTKDLVSRQTLNALIERGKKGFNAK